MSFWQKIKQFFSVIFAKSDSKVLPKTPIESAPLSNDDSEYRKLFDSMTIRSTWTERAKAQANLILKGRARYETIEKETGVPWYMVGCIHLLEGSCNFNTHLHNGDSLKRRTVNVPSGRPRIGNPPFSWEYSAIDALAYDSIKAPLETIGAQFKAFERFNGMGYRNKGINTPYLWSGSSHYSKGKYVRDGKYDANAVSAQVGIACIYKIFQKNGIIKI